MVQIINSVFHVEQYDFFISASLNHHFDTFSSGEVPEADRATSLEETF